MYLHRNKSTPNQRSDRKITGSSIGFEHNSRRPEVEVRWRRPGLEGGGAQAEPGWNLHVFVLQKEC